jgi:hypothetical protein
VNTAEEISKYIVQKKRTACSAGKKINMNILSLARKIPFIKKELSRVSSQSYRAGRKAESTYTETVKTNLTNQYEKRIKKLRLELDRYKFIAKHK